MKITPLFLVLGISVVPMANTFGATTETVQLKFQTVVERKDLSIQTRDALPPATEPTNLIYDKVRNTFSSYENAFLITSSSDVTAKLKNSVELVEVTNNKKKIQVEVKLNSHELTTASYKVHPGSSDELTYAFTVKPKGGKHSDGTYSGDVVIIFEAS